MSVSLVSSNVQNTNALQQQTQPTRGREMENDSDKDDVASKAATQRVSLEKTTAQKVVVEKADAQKVDAQKTDAQQKASHATVNTSGQTVGSVIDTQA